MNETHVHYNTDQGVFDLEFNFKKEKKERKKSKMYEKV